jgi:hypothetical protein
MLKVQQLRGQQSIDCPPVEARCQPQEAGTENKDRCAEQGVVEGAGLGNQQGGGR